MNLPQLRYFVKLAELQHYARAAKELYISQPSLTHAIQSLEAELGEPLFKRVGRGVELTEYGMRFSEYVARGLAEIDRGIELAGEFNKGLSGKVRIGAVFTVQGDYLPELIENYRLHHNNAIEAEVYQGFTLDLVDGLDRDVYDVAFCARVPNRPDICFDHVISHELVVCVNRDNELAERTSLKLEELAGKKVFTYRRGIPIGEEVADLLNGTGLEVAAYYEDEISLGGAVRRDEEACGLATLSIGLRCYSDLAIIPLEDVPKEFHRIYMAYRQENLRSRAVESFIEFTHDYMPSELAAPRTA